MIKVKDLCKNYGKKTALKNISFEIEKGSIVGLLGLNGAGKSTLFNIITGCLAQTSGAVEIEGIEASKDPNAIKKKIGYLPEIPPLYYEMTVNEYLKYVCGLKQCKKDVKKQIDNVCSEAGITEVRNRLIRNLSKGYKQRVGLASALIGNPPLLILDEPTVGLDPTQIVQIRNLIKSLGKTKTVIVSSHILSEISSICERVIIINNGEIIADGKPEEIEKSINGQKHIELSVVAENEKAIEILKSLDKVISYKVLPTDYENVSSYYVECDATIETRKLISEQFSKENIPVVEMSCKNLTLEEAFLKLVTNSKEVQDGISI